MRIGLREKIGFKKLFSFKLFQFKQIYALILFFYNTTSFINGDSSSIAIT